MLHWREGSHPTVTELVVGLAGHFGLPDYFVVLEGSSVNPKCPTNPKGNVLKFLNESLNPRRKCNSGEGPALSEFIGANERNRWLPRRVFTVRNPYIWKELLFNPPDHQLSFA